MVVQCPIWYLTLDELPILLLSSGCEFRNRGVEGRPLCHPTNKSTDSARPSRFGFTISRDSARLDMANLLIGSLNRRAPGFPQHTPTLHRNFRCAVVACPKSDAAKSGHLRDAANDVPSTTSNILPKPSR